MWKPVIVIILKTTTLTPLKTSYLALYICLINNHFQIIILLETLFKVICLYGCELFFIISFSLLKQCPFLILFISGNNNKITWSKIRWIRSMGQRSSAVFCWSWQTDKGVWEGALSWWKTQFAICHISYQIIPQLLQWFIASFQAQLHKLSWPFLILERTGHPVYDVINQHLIFFKNKKIIRALEFFPLVSSF